MIFQSKYVPLPRFLSERVMAHRCSWIKIGLLKRESYPYGVVAVENSSMDK